MENKCKQCGNLNENEAQFCDNCGASFSGDSKPIENITKNNDTTPAEQATVMINKTKEKTEQTTKAAKKIWKKFLFPEQIIIIGAFLGIASFFLPWVKLVFDMEKTSGSGFDIATDWWYLFLYPIAMLISLALIYFSQGALITSKIKLARWQILIGTFCLAISVVCLAVIGPAVDLISDGVNELIKDISEMASYWGYENSFGGISISFSSGLWVLLLSSLLIIIGAFKLQSVLLDKIKE